MAPPLSSEAIALAPLHLVRGKDKRDALLLHALDNDFCGKGQVGRYIDVMNLPRKERSSFKKQAQLHIMELSLFSRCDRRAGASHAGPRRLSCKRRGIQGPRHHLRREREQVALLYD